jgi:uncharacterized protein YbbK (DUF523 family)
LGQPVRYDGRHKRNACITGLLSTYFDWFPVCPEVGIGMGVPRPPIQLVKQGDRVHALGREDANVDVTAALQAYAQQLSAQLAGVSGYVFKSRSPSCGLMDTDLFNPDGTLIGQATGVFAAEVQMLLPGLPLIDEISLVEPLKCEAFVHRVRDYQTVQQGIR